MSEIIFGYGEFEEWLNKIGLKLEDIPIEYTLREPF